MGNSVRRRAARTVAALVVALTGCTTILQIDNGGSVAPPGSETGPGAAEGGAEGSVPDLDGALLPLDDAAPDPLEDASVDHYVPGCPGPASCERVVFVTSAAVKFAQLATADDVCTAAAAAAGAHPRIANRVFQAWTSTAAKPVDMRFIHGTGGYVRPVGVNRVIAASWTDLTDGTVNAIFHDETGKGVAAAVKVWTGTAPSGLLKTPNCGDWAEPLGTATTGVVAGAAGNWTAFTAVPCNATEDAHLYCFEK
jgi:hypothetical protein